LILVLSRTQESKIWLSSLKIFKPFQSREPDETGDSLNTANWNYDHVVENQPKPIIMYMKSFESAIHKMKMGKEGCDTAYNIQKLQ